MATDRAFRALGRAEPETVLALVRLLAPQVLSGTPRLLLHLLHDGLDTWMDPPPRANEANLVLRLDDDGSNLHLEGQGYREERFDDRAMRYHLMLCLRHWGRKVHTVALWLVPAGAATGAVAARLDPIS